MNNTKTKQITINLNQKAYNALSKVAKAMNRVDWCYKDNTVESLLEQFCEVFEEPRIVADNIIAGIDTECDDKKENARRIAALKAAFRNIR